MTLVKEFLREKAKFYSPPPNGDSTQESFTQINDLEVAGLERAWVPLSGRRDLHMVDALLKALDDYLQDLPLPVPQAKLDRCFQPLIDNDGTKGSWQSNISEYQARTMVQVGAFDALYFFMESLGYPIKVKHDINAPGFGSLTDFVISGSENKTILVEVKAPNVFDGALSILNDAEIRIRLECHVPSDEAVISELCLHMSSYKTRWLALTSHDKWVFFRLHDNVPEPYITYSNVEQQVNNTRPFRALLGMMLATELHLDVEDNPDLAVTLPIGANVGDRTEEPKEVQRQDQYGSHSGKTCWTITEPLILRPKDTTIDNAMRSPELLISWAESGLRDTRWMSYHAVNGTEQCSSLGTDPVRLRLQRFLGRGSTGVVYEAKHDTDGCDEALQSRCYALKTIINEDRKGRLRRLKSEFNIYRIIEQARRDGKECNAAPRCYDLYESPNILALILDYEGEPLTGAEWSSLEYQDKIEIFNAVRELHGIGVGHYDLDPRNIVHNANGRYKIIDFSSGKMHRCRSVRQEDESSIDTYDGKCCELKSLWREFFR